MSGIWRLCCAGIISVSLLPPLAHAQEAIRIGILAERPKAQMLNQWKPLAIHLEQTLGQPVMVAAYNHQELENAVAQNAIDVVLTSPGQFIYLQHFYNLSAPLASIINREGEHELQSFGGVILARADNQHINELADLAGQRIAYVDARGLGGYQAQLYEMLSAGLGLPDKGKLLAMGLPQDLVVAAVLSGRADAGFVRSGLLENMVSEGKLEWSRIKVINRHHLPSFPFAVSTRLYPEWPLAVLPHVNEYVARKLTVALLSLRGDSFVARNAGISGFSIPSDYSGVEKLMHQLRLPPFDAASEMTLGQMWRQYSWWIVALVAALLVVLVMGAGLLLKHRQITRSERLFRTLADTVPVGVFRADSTGACIYVNDRCCDIAGFTRAEALGAGWGKHVHPEDRQRIGEQWARCVQSGENFVAEYRFLKADGGISWVLGRSSAEYDEHGKVIGYIGTNTDITELKHAAMLRDALLDAQAEAGVGMLMVTAEARVVSANRALQAICGYTQEEVLALPTFLDLVHADDRERVMQNHRRRMAGESFERSYDLAILHKSGERREINIATASVPIGERMHTLVMVFDITERKRAEDKLRLAASVFSHAREGIVITDAETLIVDVNATYTDITGYARDEVLGKNPLQVMSGYQDPALYAEVREALVSHGFWSGEVWNRRKDGTLYAERANISAVRDAQGRLSNVVKLFTDITEIKEHQNKLEHLAHYDGLTGLPNRMLLADRMQQDMAKCQRRKTSMAVVYLDLDGFKQINDMHGHNIGDELLIALAKRMKGVLRDGDTLARIGGDEFVAVLVDMDNPHDCDPVLERLLRAAADPVHMRQLVLQVSASIGVTIYPQDGADAEVLIRHADQSMYLAKQAGKNRYHLFDVDRDAAVKSRRENLERIQQALRQNEFVLYYQPKVNMQTGEVIGAEALIRWQHPQRGLLAPGLFLPAIEGHQLSIQVGEWVIKTALEQMSSWQAAGFRIPVSVNISADHLQQQGFVERMRELLAAYPGVQRGSLELEVLETSALEDIERVSAVMFGCRESGVRFALDDFGTGYSSLTYLKRLPAEVLKIDQSFVREMTDHPDDLAIVEGVLGLATAFRRDAIAEGVETEVHGEMLLPLGCIYAQGYGIARPMPAAALPQWAANWKTFPSWAAWQDRAYNRDAMTVVYAEVEHRHWINQIESSIADNSDRSVPVMMHQCHFARWSEMEARALYGMHPAYQSVVEMHNRIHKLGFELLGFHAQGMLQEAQQGLRTLHELRDSLIKKLRSLYNISVQ